MVITLSDIAFLAKRTAGCFAVVFCAAAVVIAVVMFVGYNVYSVLAPLFAAHNPLPAMVGIMSGVAAGMALVGSAAHAFDEWGKRKTLLGAPE